MHQPGGVNVQQRLGIPRALHARSAKAIRHGRWLLAAILAMVFAIPAAAVPTIDISAAPAPIEQPALWVLSDADTTIYLFGTFHALDERTDWFARNIRAAFDAADELVLETIVPSDPVELFATLSRHSLTAPAVVGAPVIASGRSGSMASSAGATMAAGTSAGLSVERGADAVLRRIADAEGKLVDGLESFDFQINMFATLRATAPAPHTVVTSPQPDVKQLLLDMRSAWKRGDGSRIAAVLGTLEAQSPGTYQRLFVDRNRNWARVIAERMERPGTVFVAVGTGHLIGRDSLQRKLSRHGLTATRIH
ncbi:MAG: TraB/GumN family protein [Sphingomonas bacterium]|nr:TraB/GumN family protein [Sphingomonas bacterium]